MVTVHYHELVPMLLNEIQKLSAKVAEDRAERLSFQQRLSALEQKMQAKNAASLANASPGD